MVVGTNLTYRGYVIPKGSLSATELDAIRKELTVKPYIPKDYQIGPTKSYTLYLESEHHLYVPKHFGLDTLGSPEQCHIFPGRPLDPAACRFQGSMRDEQLAACQAFFEHASNATHGGGGILNLPCGFGKTVIGLYIVSQLRLKTLIIVHKDFLLQQWRERISQFLPDISVGMLKASIIDAGDDRDIVIASLQSLSMKDYDVKNLFQSFGLVIVDECHHTSAEVFSNALKKTCFKYTLGLSATLQRKDGLSRVFKWFLGPVAYKPPKQTHPRPLTSSSASGIVTPSVHTVIVKIREFFDVHPSYSTERYMLGGTKLNVSRMINQICEYTPRNAFIANEIHEVLKKDPQRRVLILSDRREHLRALAAEMEAIGLVRSGDDYGYYQGGLDQKILKESERKKFILGTFQFVAEGFDVPGLDTLVLASPKSDIVQSVGRILRQRPEDRTYPPLVLDITDDISLFPAQAKKRRAYYSSKRYWIDDGSMPRDRSGSDLRDMPSDDVGATRSIKRPPKRMTAEEIAATFQNGTCFILDEDDG